jgi:hypothetical protein
MAVNLQKKAVNLQKKAVYLQKKAVYLQKKAVYLQFFGGNAISLAPTLKVPRQPVTQTQTNLQSFAYQLDLDVSMQLIE